MSSETPTTIEGSLYVEVFKIYEEMYCCILGRKFQAFRKARPNIPASASNKAELALQFEIIMNETESKIVKFSLADLSKVMKASKLSETPFFFSVTVQDKVYMLAAGSEELRSSWIKSIRGLSRARDKRADAWISTGFLQDPLYAGATGEQINRFSTRDPQQRNTSRQEEGRRQSMTRKSKAEDKNEDEIPYNSKNDRGEDVEDVEIKIEEVDDEGGQFLCFKSNSKICGLKIETLSRLLQVCTAFPFVIVVSSLNLSSKYTFLRSLNMVRLMNILIYVAPVIYIRFLLSQFNDISIQRIAIGLYILLYLFPVGYVVSTKVQVSSSTSKIEEGTFCFKPARIVRFTQANFYAVVGFIMEWIQHMLYVLPLGIVTGDKAAKLSDFPPYLPFEVFLWMSVSSTFICGLIVILNAVLRGKLHYRFQSSYTVWFFVFNVGSPMFVTIVTILFMTLNCDYSTDPPSLTQQPEIECWSDYHIVMARAALIAFAIYIIQHTLLPSGTFKETMRDNDLEIMFVPVYLQAHYLLKAIFCGVYVYFYEDNYTRVITLTVINMMLLALNNFMKPCSVDWVNLLRDGFFVHATLSGIISVNYLAWPNDRNTKGMVITTLASTVLFSTVGLLVYYRYTVRSTEYTIASAFLDLEWQVSRGGSVHPRVLEPLISLTLSSKDEDKEIAKKYIGQLVWLISYPNMRVQFQSAWGLANLALLDDDARLKIHEAGGTKSLFEWYMEMDFVVQLEVLAAMANLTLSYEVADAMVSRHKCIPFFIELVASNKVKHSQFATIGLANLARKEVYREMIRKQNGIPALVGCIMSHNYQKRRHGSRALANMALSPTKEIEQVFESKGLIDRILKMALRKETETQMEVVALIRNLACHARLRPLLLDRGVMNAVEASKESVYSEVKDWCAEITILLQREISSGAIDLKALMRREGAKGQTVGETDMELLKRMEPLKAKVEWSTWGSKLETIFEPVFASVPSLTNSQISTPMDAPISILLPAGLSKQDLLKWRDVLSYTVIERPTHGKLSEYYTYYDYVTYTPAPGYIGTDFFTYHMSAGTILTAPVTVAINVIDPDLMTSDNMTDGGKSTRGRGMKAASEDLESGNRKLKKGKSQDDMDGVEMEEIYQEKEKRGMISPKAGSTGGGSSSNATPFLDNLMRKTSTGANAAKSPDSSHE